MRILVDNLIRCYFKKAISKTASAVKNKDLKKKIDIKTVALRELVANKSKGLSNKIN